MLIALFFSICWRCYSKECWLSAPSLYLKPNSAKPMGFIHFVGPELIQHCWKSYNLLPRKCTKCCLLVRGFMDAQKYIHGPRLRRFVIGSPKMGGLSMWEVDPNLSMKDFSLISIPFLSSSSDEQSADLCVGWVLLLSFQSKAWLKLKGVPKRTWSERQSM